MWNIHRYPHPFFPCNIALDSIASHWIGAPRFSTHDVHILILPPPQIVNSSPRHTRLNLTKSESRYLFSALSSEAFYISLQPRRPFADMDSFQSTLTPEEVTLALVQQAVVKHRMRYDLVFFKAVGFLKSFSNSYVS